MLVNKAACQAKEQETNKKTKKSPQSKTKVTLANSLDLP